MFRKSALAIAAVGIAATVPLADPLNVADAATTAVRTTTTHAATNVAPEETFRLKNKSANECLDGNADYFLYPCNSGRFQQWQFQDAGQGKVRIYWDANRKCITSGFGFVDCNDRDAAKFTIEKVKLNYEFLKIRSVASGKCLTSDRSIVFGWTIKNESCSGDDHQLWIKQ
ncbi:RICIN domain-containing protein [Streptomyces sp. NPDC087845]|uniref:RICIN domain-containing protein n=1 Tax=Streptomyces sp. NPDC087845 TaxID=3365806 RepID=UPI003817F473